MIKIGGAYTRSWKTYLHVLVARGSREWKERSPASAGVGYPRCLGRDPRHPLRALRDHHGAPSL